MIKTPLYFKLHYWAWEKYDTDPNFRIYMHDYKPGGGQYWDKSWRGPEPRGHEKLKKLHAELLEDEYYRTTTWIQRLRHSWYDMKREARQFKQMLYTMKGGY